MRPGAAASLALACAVLGACAAPAGPATEDDVDRLEPGAIACDPASIRALFELRRRADGAVLEGIEHMLGGTIRRCPGVLLQELQQNVHPYIDGILANLGPDFVDDFDAQRREMQLRVAALQTVDAPELAGLRDRCIARLQQSIAERKHRCCATAAILDFDVTVACALARLQSRRAWRSSDPTTHSSDSSSANRSRWASCCAALCPRPLQLRSTGRRFA